MLSRLFNLLGCLVILALSTVQAQETPEQLFENSIRPVLTGTCFSCHGNPKAKLSGGLRVDSREALLEGGDSGSVIDLQHPEESLLLKAIAGVEGVSPMPPNKDRSLRADQVAAFKRWIAGGAAWPKNATKFEGPQHWAFQPLATGEQPHDIDYWIRAKQSAAQTTMAPRADKRTLLRRAAFDLTGLPPSHEQLLEFVDDDSPQAYARLIDRLLNSTAYGERWGRHWLDIVRYADTAGETADYPVPNAWRYRNYVIDAFNRDLPYDQFLREQIAGDILAQEAATADEYATQVTATGYLAISRRFGFDSENYHHLTIQDTIDTLGQSVLGLSLGCVRCHDHKFDPISMQDYYGLYGIFDSSRYAFPGSEQKQKVRSMMPLVPARQALVAWRKFDERVVNTRQSLERNGQPTTPAVLRMLNDMDGDFELQAPADGGSYGVLVPPWMAEGPVAVSAAAQSPYRNLYGAGKSGIRIESSNESVAYRVVQSLTPRRTAARDPKIVLNLDFRIAAAAETFTGSHQLWLGGTPDAAALQIEFKRNTLHVNYFVPGPESAKSLKIATDKWHNLQIEIDLAERRCSVKLDEAGEAHVLRDIPLLKQWNGTIDLLKIVSDPSLSSGPRTAIEFDNLAIDEAPSGGQAATQADAASATSIEDAASLNKQLAALVGTDSDFELQTIDSPPTAPWDVGPNSVVKIMARSQSPDSSRFPAGSLGVHMPNRGEYDGFGSPQSTTWKAETQPELVATFDFRCAEVTAGGDGSWRYYIGHGPGHSAAVELFFNGQQLFTRSGDARTAVGSLKAGQWYNVQLQLQLKDRKFRGQLRALDGEPHHFEWQSDFASGWDGSINHTFIDSYGHIGGVRPSLDVDNYRVGPVVVEGGATGLAGDNAVGGSLQTIANKRAQVALLRQRLANLSVQLKAAAESLQRDLASGPFEMAYAVAEGTPHDVAIQLRGEPSQPGEIVPRGFIKILGGKSLPTDQSGSGRLPLANWLTREVSHLTARVIVNRIWQFHFGRGLVVTPNDFGVRGAVPTHPELLDQLASDFIRGGWSIKALHRQIMLSETYQQASVWPGSETTAAPSPELYVGYARRRLSAEEIRDSLLSVSGLLDRTPGAAHPFTAPTTWGYTQHAPFSAVYDHDKRSIYLMTQRLKRHPFLALFDGPDPNASTAVRLGTTVPTQALYFMNDPFVHRASQAWSRQLLNSKATNTERIASAYHIALQRQPTAMEQSDAESFLKAYQTALAEANIGGDDPAGSQALAALLRALMGSNEFLHVD